MKIATLALLLTTLTPALAQTRSHRNTEQQDAVQERGTQEQGTQAQQTAQRIELNSATESDLVSLPGIGPSKAAAIMAHRARRPFNRVEDLMQVRGIGRGTFRALRERIEVRRPAVVNHPPENRRRR